MKVKQLNLTKWHVEIPFVGTVFVGKEDDCHEYVIQALSREQRFRYENLTEHKDFESFQPV